MNTKQFQALTAGKSGECWPWPKCHNGKGYGIVIIEGKRMYAHRLAYELKHGPTSLHILHSCDNPPCCNPAHLRAGTRVDNMADMHTRGRARTKYARGAKHWKAKLNAQEVAEIRALVRDGWTSKSAIGRAYGLQSAAVDKIVRRRTWVVY